MKLRLITATVLTASVVTACSSTSTTPTDTGTHSGSPSPTPTTTGTLSQLNAEFQSLVAIAKPVDLDTTRLPAPPKGYTEADVKALAKYAIDLSTKSRALVLSDLTPKEAVEYVVADMPPGMQKSMLKSVTTKGKVTANGALGIANRYVTEPTQLPVVVAAQWSAKDGTGSNEGTLVVSLSTWTATESPYSGGLGSLLVDQTFDIIAIDAQGDPADGWWPGWNYRLAVYGMDKKTFLNRSLLAPGTDPKVLQVAVAKLRKLLSE